MFLIKLLLLKKKLLTFLPIILKNWKISAIVILSAIVFYQNTFETRVFFGAETIPALEKRLAINEKAFNTCVAGNQTLSKAITKVNNIIQQQALDGQALKLKFDNVKNDLINNQKMNEKTIQQLINEPAPTSCTSAIQYLKDKAIQ